MKHLLLVFYICLANLTWAQPSFKAAKQKNNCISFYIGASVFEEYRIGQTYQNSTYRTLNPNSAPSFMAISNLLSLTYKYKKHEIIPVLYFSTCNTDNEKSKHFLMGGSLSYLYHFSQKRAHLFFEGNFQTYFYTTQDAIINITPYGSNMHYNDWITSNWHAAHIQNYVLNSALGLEVKLWPLTYLQFAVGSGAYYLKGKPAIPSSVSSPWGMPDEFKNTYPAYLV